MTDAELIEAAARAIYEQDDPWQSAFPWPNLPEIGQADGYRAAAQAALTVLAPALMERGAKAMREKAENKALMDLLTYEADMEEGSLFAPYSYDAASDLHKAIRALDPAEVVKEARNG